MYAPRPFRETDPATLRDAARRYRAGNLITVGSEGLESSFIPLLISDDARVITGHLAKANRQWARVDTCTEALVTWQGPDAYVSPNYYPSKKDDGRVVPTWNFISIQAHGSLVIHHELDWKRAHVSALTNQMEGDQLEPWSVDDAPSDFIDTMAAAIVGVEISVTSLEGKWKLSQNRTASDIAGVIDALREPDPSLVGPGVAAEMEHIVSRMAPDHP